METQQIITNLKGSNTQLILLILSLAMFIIGLIHSYINRKGTTDNFFMDLIRGIQEKGIWYLIAIAVLLFINIIISRTHPQDLLYDKISIWALSAIITFLFISPISNLFIIFKQSEIIRNLILCVLNVIIPTVMLVFLWLPVFLDKFDMRRIFIIIFPILMLINFIISVILRLSLRGFGW